MSDNGVYGLGALELRMADVGLNLRLSSEVKIATFEEDGHNGTTRIRRLTAQLFRGDGVWKPWVVKSHGYHLRIDLEIAPELKLEDESFAHQVAVRLKQFKIWESLGFVVSSIETGPSDHRATSWILYLDYSERKVSSARVKLHKLSPGLPYHDTKPPPGVHVIKVEAFSVRIILEESPGKPGVCKDDRNTHEHENATSFDGESLFHNLDATEEVQLYFDVDAEFGDSSDLQCSPAPRDTPEWQDRNMFAADSSCAYSTPPPSQEKTEHSRTSLSLNTSQDVCTETLLSTLEIGLRHAMCKLPARKSKTNVILSNEDFDCLSAIAPALWVPDYHQSLSERAVFLPTISHAISNVSGYASTKSGLRTKAWQLSHRYPHLGKGTLSPDPVAKMDEVREAFSASLWTEMTAGLSNARTARQSHPFGGSFDSTHEVDALQEMDGMLDETATDDGSGGTFDESEFEDLLDMASDADDEESTYNWSGSDLGDMNDQCSTEALRDRLPSRWISEHPSRLDPDSGTVDDSPELVEMDLRGVVEVGDGGGGGSTGSHREISQRWDDSYYAHDSMALQYLEMERAELEAEDMLLWDLGDADAKCSSGQQRTE